jgi:small-conductance mechanosensitive channel
MIRLLLVLLAILALPPLAAAAEPAPPPAITADQAKAALDVLNDPKKRAAFQATLQAIVAARPEVQAPETGLQPGSLGAQILLRMNASMNHLRQRIESAAASVESVPLLWAWLVVMVTDPVGQSILSGVGWRLLLAIAAAAGAGWAVQRLLRSVARRLDALALAEDENPVDRAELGDLEALGKPGTPRASFARQPWLTLARIGLRLLPILALLAAGHIVALAVDGTSASGLVIEAVLEAAGLTLVIVETARILLAPQEKRLRPVALNDAAASYLMRWAQRLTITAVAGYAIAEVGVLLGLSDPGHDAILDTTGLLLTAGLIAMILRLRRPMRRALRGPADAKGAAARLRDGFARIWHWLALLALATLWFGWAADISVSGEDAARTIGSIVLVLVVAKLVLMGLLHLIDRLPAIGNQVGDGLPSLQERAYFYHPALTSAVRGTVHLLAVLALLQILGSGSLHWLWRTEGGQRLVSGVLTLAVTVLAAVTVWELVNAAIQRHLNRLQQDAQFARSVRLRTLLPMLRTTLLATIGVVTLLMVLSEIGVDIAPLLAGAGILGVAIGFGSQKLVQDLITGIFLLLENAIQVGDWVSVAGLSGRVEGLSVRTIRLRAADGALHIVPFSSVTSVTNNTKGVGNADVRATVDFGVDTDQVAEIMKGIVAEMRTEPDFEAKIRQDFQLFGVDKIDASGVTITGQVACTDSGRWSVQREINRRIKQRFDAVGIRFFNTAAPLPIAG